MDVGRHSLFSRKKCTMSEQVEVRFRVSQEDLKLIRQAIAWRRNDPFFSDRQEVQETMDDPLFHECGGEDYLDGWALADVCLRWMDWVSDVVEDPEHIRQWEAICQQESASASSLRPARSRLAQREPMDVNESR